MRTERLWVLAFLVPATIAIVACSSDPPPKGSTKGDDDDKPTQTDKDETETSESPVTAAPKPVVTTPVDAGLRLPDASVAQPPPNSRPPAPTTRFCQQLNSCCGQLGFLDQIACRLTAGYNNETACGVELAVCAGGGFAGIADGVGGLFQDNNPECTTLARCCNDLQNQGFGGSASDCKTWAETADEGLCRQANPSFCGF